MKLAISSFARPFGARAPFLPIDGLLEMVAPERLGGFRSRPPLICFLGLVFADRTAIDPLDPGYLGHFCFVAFSIEISQGVFPSIPF